MGGVDALDAGEVLAPGDQRRADGLGRGHQIADGNAILALAVGEDAYVLAQAIDLVPVMGDEQHVSVIVPQHLPQLAFHLPLEIPVQRGKRLVQQQTRRVAEQHTGQRHALLLSAGELMGIELLDFFQMEGAELFVHGEFAAHLRDMAHGGEQILPHGHVGEQGVALEQVAHMPRPRRFIDELAAVEQHMVVQDDGAAVGLFQPRDAFEGHALAAARRAQKTHDAAVAVKMHVEGEVPQLFVNVNGEAHLPFLPSFFSNRLTASNTTAEMAMLMSTQRSASASLPVRQSW